MPKLYIGHAFVRMGSSLEELVEVLERFLSKFPQEFVLVRLKKEIQTADNDKFAEGVLSSFKRIEHLLVCIKVTGNTKMSAVAGKAVLIVENWEFVNLSEDLIAFGKRCFVNRWLEYDFQDDFMPADLDLKFKKFVQHLEKEGTD